MTTLLQTLILQTLTPGFDLVLPAYIRTVLPAMEQVFGMAPTFNRIRGRFYGQPNRSNVEQQLVSSSGDSNQSLLIYILNSLLAAWNLLPFLSGNLALSDDEKRLLCLGFTFQSHNNFHQNELAISLSTTDTTLGEALDLGTFWAAWREYLPELGYLTQATHQPKRKGTTSARKTTCNTPESRLKLPLCQLLSFGTIAAQLTNPADIMVRSEGDRLREHLQELGIDHTLIYHRLRNGTGLLTNNIHNAVLHFAEKLDWQPLLFFAQGVVYLAPLESELPDRSQIQEFMWEQVSKTLSTKMLRGEIGFKRDGKGLKAAPQILELLSPNQLIRTLPHVVAAVIKNETDPATPKRLEKLNLNPREQRFLAPHADLRSDRIAEFIIFLQKQFLEPILTLLPGCWGNWTSNLQSRQNRLKAPQGG